ncbi:MAG TPA: hypothetical protein EYP36_00075 [Calditrichaeota bacterium]|nr:hypothetical protein [Calditrichota bacterium]
MFRLSLSFKGGGLILNKLFCEGGDIGRTAIWKNEMEGIYYQNHLHRVRAKVNETEPEFILNWMQYAFLYGKVYFGRANTATIPNLSKSRLSEFTIPKPSPRTTQNSLRIKHGAKSQSAARQTDTHHHRA